MEERLIIKSEQRKLKIIAIVLFAAAALFVVNGAYYMINGLVNNVRNYYPNVSEYYDSKLDYILYVAGKHFDSFIIQWIIGAVLIAAGVFAAKKLGKCLLILSNTAVYGFDFLGRKVELPLAQVTGVKTGAFGGAEISHTAGKIKFMLMKNRDEVFGEIIKALNAR